MLRDSDREALYEALAENAVALMDQLAQKGDWERFDVACRRLLGFGGRYAGYGLPDAGAAAGG